MGINGPSEDYNADTAAEHQNEGRWKQFTGKAQETYGDLTNDWSEQFKGNTKEAMGWLQERYGDAREKLGEYWEDDESADNRKAA